MLPNNLVEDEHMLLSHRVCAQTETMGLDVLNQIGTSEFMANLTTKSLNNYDLRVINMGYGSILPRYPAPRTLQESGYVFPSDYKFPGER